MLKKYLECGKIVSTHGVRGELKVQVWADSPDYLFNFKKFYTNNGKKEYKVVNIRGHQQMVLLTLEGITDIDMARELRGEILYIDREDDPDDTPFLQDYIGINVIDVDTDENYGELITILETGANNVYVLKDKDNNERLVPDIPQVIVDINLNERIMKIRPLEGLFDDED